jgi:hypothetical protein
VAPSCGARPRVSTQPLRPASAPGPWATPGPRPRAPLCLQTAIVKKPRRARTWKAIQFQGAGAKTVAMFAIQCTHPSHTRRGAWLLQENVNSRTGTTPLCSHNWFVSGQQGTFWCVSGQQGAFWWSCRPKEKRQAKPRGRLQKGPLGSKLELAGGPRVPPRCLVRFVEVQSVATTSVATPR